MNRKQSNIPSIVLIGIFCFKALSLSAQERHNVSASDTLQATLDRAVSPEYITGDEDFALIKDRLSCIEKQIPLHYNEKVHAFVNYFVNKDRAYLKTILNRKHLYFPIFEYYLEKYNLPDELKYLSIIESGLNPKAVSRARAVGLWQFMPRTGKYYKLNQDWYIDDRMDPHKSTEAACRYLKMLYNMFGDWELALAAYNSGPGNIRKAIRRSGYKETFWEIYPNLLRETRSYLPQFVAIVYAMNYAEEHNFIIEDEHTAYLWKTDTVRLSQYLHLGALADELNVCQGDMLRLNPSVKRGVVPDKAKGFALRIPVDAYMDFILRRDTILSIAGNVGKAEMEKQARNAIGSTYGRDKIVHRVRSGDVLGKIAERYHVRVADIRRWNHLRGNTIRIGQRLNIWRNGKSPSSTVARVSKDKAPQTLPLGGAKIYFVQPGDTLWDISRKYQGLSIEKIKALNNLKGNKIKPGQKLILG